MYNSNRFEFGKGGRRSEGLGVDGREDVGGDVCRLSVRGFVSSRVW